MSHGARFFRTANLWILAVMYFCYNFNLNVYNDWFPTYLHDSRGMTLAKMGIYASLPLFAGTLGDLAGGWFSDRVLRRTGNVNLARRWVAIAGFLLSAAATIPAVLAHDPKVSVAFYCVGVLRPGMDRGHFLGGAARYRRRLRRFGLGRDEHARQHRRSGLGAVVTYAATHYGWNAPFLITSALVSDRAGLYLEDRRDETGRVKIAVKINPDKCVACGNCTYVCPMGAIYIDPAIQRATINSQRMRRMLCLLQRTEPGASESHVGAHAAQVVSDGCGCASIRSRTSARPPRSSRTNWSGRAWCAARFPIRACRTNRPACKGAAPKK